MIFNRTDKLFEDAARSPEQFDLLLKRLRRARCILFSTFVVVILIVLVGGGWFSVKIMLALRGPQKELLSLLQRPHFFDASQLSYLSITFTVFIFSLMGAAMEVDGRIKMLLLFRAAREAQASNPGASADRVG